MSKGTNVATFYNAPGFNKFSAFYAECKAEDNDLDPVASPAQLVPDLEDDEVMREKSIQTEYEAWQPRRPQLIPHDEATTNKAQQAPPPSTKATKKGHRIRRQHSPAPVLFTIPSTLPHHNTPKSPSSNPNPPSNIGLPRVGKSSKP